MRGLPAAAIVAFCTLAPVPAFAATEDHVGLSVGAQ